MEQSAWNVWVILSACQRKQLGLICWCKVTAKQNTFLTLQPLEVAFPLQASNMPKSKFSACEQSISFHKLFLIYSVNSLWSETASESSPSPTRTPDWSACSCTYVHTCVSGLEVKVASIHSLPHKALCHFLLSGSLHSRRKESRGLSLKPMSASSHSEPCPFLRLRLRTAHATPQPTLLSSLFLLTTAPGSPPFCFFCCFF